MQVTAYNSFGTKESRIVARFETEAADAREALQEAVYTACMWNKNEDRDNMRVYFILANGLLRTI